MFILAIITISLGVIGVAWMAAIAFAEGDTMWAIGCILIGPFVAPSYGFQDFENRRIPTILCLVGFGSRLLLKLAE